MYTQCKRKRRSRHITQKWFNGWATNPTSADATHTSTLKTFSYTESDSVQWDVKENKKLYSIEKKISFGFPKKFSTSITKLRGVRGGHKCTNRFVQNKENYIFFVFFIFICRT